MMGEYEKQADEIIADAGAILTEEARREVRKALATFARENSVTDLKIA